MSQFNAELSFAKQLAYEAGNIMLHYFNAKDKGVTIKEDASPVTLADTEINALVIQRVKEHFLADGVLGEEDSFNLGSSAKPDIYDEIAEIIEPVLQDYR